MSCNGVAIVTGSSKGLGYALVKRLCVKFEGTVYLTSRDEQRGRQACKQLTQAGLNPVYHQLDVADPDSISRFSNHIKEHHGKVDVLINNAGILFLKNVKESKLFIAEETIKVNFFGLVNFTEAMLPLIKDGGSILNISSSSGHLSRIPSEELRRKFSAEDLSLIELEQLIQRYVKAVELDREMGEGWGDSPYVVSKVGVNAYTFRLHRLLQGRGIKVNCIHPGYVRSDMTRGVGNVTPEAAAEAPLQLALQPRTGGLYVWHNGQVVPWDSETPSVMAVDVDVP